MSLFFVGCSQYLCIFVFKNRVYSQDIQHFIYEKNTYFKLSSLYNLALGNDSKCSIQEWQKYVGTTYRA